MKILITAFVIAAVALSTQAYAQQQTVIVNNYPARFCYGLIGCLLQHQWDEEERQRSVGPHVCNVWNGHRYQQALCGP